MLVETGKKIFYLSPDTGKESGNISTPGFKQSLYKAHSSMQLKYKHKYSMVHTSDTT